MCIIIAWIVDEPVGSKRRYWTFPSSLLHHGNYTLGIVLFFFAVVLLGTSARAEVELLPREEIPNEGIDSWMFVTQKKNPKWLTHCCWFDEYSNDTSCRYMQIDVCVLPTLNAASDRTRKCISFLKNRLQEKQHEKHFCWQNAHNFILGRNMVHQKLLCDTRLSRRNELMLWCYETRGVQAWRWFTL